MPPWISPDPGDQSEPRGDSVQNDRNPDGSSSSGCAMSIPKVAWTIVKVITLRLVGRKPDYVT